MPTPNPAKFKLAVLRKRVRENPMDGVKSPRGKKLTRVLEGKNSVFDRIGALESRKTDG